MTPLTNHLPSLLGFFLLFVCLRATAQEQWASQVIGASSAYANAKKPTQFQAVQVLGKPRKLPSFGSSPCVWSPATQNNTKTEWIHVGFNQPMRIQQVAIAESHNPGAVSAVYAYDGQKREYLLYQNEKPKPLSVQGRVFHVFVEKTDYLVHSVKVMLNTAAVPGWNHIDAIAISPSNVPVEARIAVVDDELTNAEVERLPGTINTEYDEIFPIISPDGKTLYFDRKNHPDNFKDPTVFKETGKINDDIWYAELVGGEWQQAVHMSAPLNNVHHNYVCSVTPDGNTLLVGNVYLKDGTAAGGVSMSHRTPDGWSFPEKLQIDNYSNLNRYSEFSLASNGKILFLAIERDDSFGDRDIYVSFKKEDGRWSEPKNLGPDVNTAATELTPFLAADGYTLYFASLGYSGYGSADMYVSRRLDDSWTRWSEPLNMGSSFNSPDWDASYTVDASGEYAYFVSYKNSTAQSADIFRARLPQKAKPKPAVIVYGKVFNAKTGEGIQAEIAYESLKSGTEIGIASSSPKDASYKIALPAGENYGFWAKAKGFLALTENLDLNGIEAYAEIERNLYLTPIEVGQSVRLNNIFFVQSEAALMEESFPELDRIVRTFLDNPSLEVVLEGHTDLGGDPILNMQLSKQRVEVVKSYLVRKGVRASRIETEAYGSTRPLSRARDPESMKLNRRVEFKITKIEK